MKKYNLSNIMKRAWVLVKELKITISCGLKKAWQEAKKAMEKIAFTERAKALKTEVENDESSYLYFKKWEKYGKVRIYINDYKNRTLGYIENGEVVIKDRQGNYQHEIDTAIANFNATYAY